MNILPIKKSTLFITFSILSASNILSLPANASDAIGPGDSDSKWIVGAAAGAFNNPFSGEDEEAWISPTVSYNGKHVSFRDSSFNIHVAKNNGFKAGIKFALDGGFLSDSDNYKNNTKLSGITERDGTVLGGVYVHHDTDLGRLSFSTLTDVGSKHDGRTALLKYTFDLKAGNWNINPELGAEWLSADYVDHYVGVSESEATDSRPQFQGEDTIIAFAGIRARYELTDNWDINLRTGVSKLGSEFEDSPIIDDDLLYQASVGINYNF